ncbi:MAG: HTTM domain-containing protein [Saprospiraceae bacterium]
MSKGQKIIWRFIDSPVGIKPLVRFRILFGGLMMLGMIRFIQEGWTEKLYLEPRYFFKFYWFEWVKPLDENGMYILLSIIIGSSAMVMLGFLYRIAIITFFVSFTYLELIDATNYLNHHYLVCLLSFLMIFLPANKSYSVDVLLWRNIKTDRVSSWTINILIFQLTVVYTFAGLAKLNYDWIFQAMPLAVWLPERQDVPLVGYFFQFKWVAFLMSWAGAFYDLTIAYFLMNSRTRPFAYFMVIVFHLMTWLLFNIGLFPWIMIVSTLVFFPEKKLSNAVKDISKSIIKTHSHAEVRNYFSIKKQILLPFLVVYMLLQIMIPFRHFLYPSNVFWSEEGYRFSWRVMLVEKSGQTTFTLKDPKTNRQTEIINSRYLTPFQEKQMSIQPDFILQFAHYLKYEYQRTHGINNPIITVDSHVALNGRVSQRFIDPSVNLAKIKDDFLPKKWILDFEK